MFFAVHLLLSVGGIVSMQNGW